MVSRNPAIVAKGLLGKASQSTAVVDGGAVLRVLVLADNAHVAPMADATTELENVQFRVHPGTYSEFANNGALKRWAETLIVQLAADDPALVEAFEAFARERAHRLPIIAAIPDLSVATTRRLLRIPGVDAISLPLLSDDLAQTIQCARQRLSQRSHANDDTGRIVTFLGALGGSGTTAVATQTGIILAQQRSVCLIDLDVQFGNAALYLDVKPKLTLGDLIAAGDRVDSELLRVVAEVHPSGLCVIACPIDMVPLDALSSEFVRRTLDAAAQIFDVVLVDRPGAWVGWAMTAIESSSATCMITTGSVPGIYQARRQIEVISANGFGDRLHVVLNRAYTPWFRKRDLGEIEHALGHAVDFAIANDYATVSSAVNEGRALSTVKSRSRVEKDISLLVQGLTTSIHHATLSK